MKIDDYHQSVNLTETTRGGASSQRAENQHAPVGETEKKEAGGGGTQVALSDASREVMKTREAMENQDPERTQKTAELKEQVAQGTYEVDSRKVAEKILGTAISDLL
jgi:negative regulator of flagellin synthesis FlgM